MQHFGGFLTRSFVRVALFAGSFGVLVSLPAASLGAQEKPKDNSMPASAMPPAGMCRVWLKDVAPAQQPAATDCATAIKNLPRNAELKFGDLSGGDPFAPRRTTTRTSISNGTGAWPREWARDPIAYRTPGSNVDPNNRVQYRTGTANGGNVATGASGAVAIPAAPVGGGVHAIRATQSAVVAQPTTPPSKPPEKPQY